MTKPFFILPDAEAGDARDQVTVNIDGRVYILTADMVAQLIAAARACHKAVVLFGEKENTAMPIPKAWTDEYPVTITVTLPCSWMAGEFTDWVTKAFHEHMLANEGKRLGWTAEGNAVVFVREED